MIVIFYFKLREEFFILSEIPDYPFRFFFSIFVTLFFYPVDGVRVTLPSDMYFHGKILGALEMEFTYLRTISSLFPEKH